MIRASGILATLTALLIGPQAAPDVATAATDVDRRVRAQLAIAMDEAEAAQRAHTAQAMQSNLQRVVNCLEGPKGPDYKALIKDPCRGQGQGAIPDLRASKNRLAAAALEDTGTALSLAKRSIARSPTRENMSGIRRDALLVSRFLSRAMDALAAP